MEMWRTFISSDNGSTEPTNISEFMGKCPSHYQIYPTVLATTEVINVVVGLPACAAILWEILQRHWRSAQRGHSRSAGLSTSSDLLMINLILVTVVHCITKLLDAINSLHSVSHLLPPRVIKVLGTVMLTAGPPSMVSICLDCYLAVGHPLKYTHLRTTWRHPLLLTMFTWLYTITMETIIIGLNLSPYNYIGIITFYMAMLTIILLNVSTLRALWLAGPGRHRLADLCPIKRQAFWVVLCILLGTVIYCLPQVILLTCWALERVEQESFICVVYPMVMIFPTVISAVVYLLFVYVQTPVKQLLIKH
ncbi:uncharacterized protein LOC143103008 [Alosa pseudoharengus]|uniref:uncharacterized protein LOC143103008 n=1 Tax=Alosa pseudoharengus TaxID=34774 RepID=UPI003F8B9D3C